MTSMVCFLEVITPFQLYYNQRMILSGQWWRLVTNFCWFGDSALDFFMHMAFLLRYAKGLEDGYGRDRWWDFAFCLCTCAGALMALAPFFPNIVFFGPSLTFMLVYLWSRRNPGMQMNLFYLLTITAPYLPWVLMGFSALVGHSGYRDLLGIAVGHTYFFLEDVWPSLAKARGWWITSVLPSPSNLWALWRWCCRRGGGGERLRAPALGAPAAAAAPGGARPVVEPPVEVVN
jgi:Derlin-2/3